MTREDLKRVNLSVKCSFVKLMLLNGYVNDSEKFNINPLLVESFCQIMGNDFEFGSAYQHIRLLKNENEQGIVAIENNGMSYRSFIDIEDNLSKVFKSVYVTPGDKKDECYISVRFFTEDQSLVEISGRTKGKGNEIQELCTCIYDSETIGKCMESNPHFNPADVNEDIKSCMSPSKTFILLPAHGKKNMSFLERYLNCFSKESEILTLSEADETDGKIPYTFFMNLELLGNIFHKIDLGGNMEAIVREHDLKEELRMLEESIPESERKISIDSLIHKFSNEYSVITVLMNFMGDLDLQPDLSYYGYDNTTVVKNEEDSKKNIVIPEKLRSLRRTAALLRLKSDIEDNNVGIPLKSEDGKRYGLIRKDKTGETILDLFDKDHVQRGSIIIYKKTLLIGDSYEPQLVVMRYSGDFAGEPGTFYEVTEDLVTRNKIGTLLFEEYDETSVLSPELFDFSYMLPGSPMDKKLMHLCDVSYEKKDLIRGLSLGLHPERIAEIRGEKFPSGRARKKQDTLQ